MPDQPLLLAYHADDRDRLSRLALELGDRLADDRAIVANPQLGHVVGDLEAFLLGGLAFAIMRDQPPADRDDECNACERHRETDWRKVEHAEALAERRFPDIRDQQVRRRADLGQHAAQ